MVILDSKSRRTTLAVAGLAAIGSMALGGCALGSLHSNTISNAPVGARCDFLSGSASTNYQRCSYAERNYDNGVAPDLNFSYSDWAFAQLNGVKMQASTFVAANFSHAAMTSSEFEGAVFRGANFSAARLIGSDLANADLRGANLTDANLRGVTGLAAGLLARVVWHSTICPDGTNSDGNGGTCLRDLGG